MVIISGRMDRVGVGNMDCLEERGVCGVVVFHVFLVHILMNGRMNEWMAFVLGL